MSQQVLPDRQTVFDRRRFLMAAGLIVGTSSLAGCGRPRPETAPFREDGVFFSALHLSIVDTLSDFMIPETDTPGARAVDAAGFSDGVLEGWALPETQVAVRKTLDWIEEMFEGGPHFLDTPSSEQLAFATNLDQWAFLPSGTPLPGQAARGYRSLKSILYRGYYLSEIGATLELQHDPVPGSFRGCVPLNEIGRTWAI